MNRDSIHFFICDFSRFLSHLRNMSKDNEGTYEASVFYHIFESKQLNTVFFVRESVCCIILAGVKG